LLQCGYKITREKFVNINFDWGVIHINKLLSVSAALLALGLSVPAKAADMPVKHVAPAPVFTWTG
jgi:hypothetical protein